MPSTNHCLSLGTQDNLGPRNYQEASIGPLSYTVHSKWRHMSLLLLAIVVQTALGNPEPFHVSADYPAGCRGGPGPGEKSSIIHLVESSCIYNMRGVTADGVQKNAAGIILNSNMPGSYGTMYINITITSPPGEPSDILVETHGRVNMGFGNESRYFWWNPAASASQGRFSGKRALFPIEAVDFASFPDDKGMLVARAHMLLIIDACNIIDLAFGRTA
ncbi:hypothetical protein Pmar_PMAR016260 [Perkinsus marinus ATCC 50983]|uniref:Uncharacterized protein n=1 Tax=Perkinsus marinus (strain ATCC 50983 / TXsc) TaxID=423536 RepID=C5KYN4_PERM5|nr:hypothetical protein Pmar_PMAR016260 [Perkinsus marinus ATCC 50983]EER10412.1 hypothetical protein Pmar_PMAR016260 [Perkinsus marinus ATCC 50983]|eukprot:XP_002778617.1 hypothetical protein Pmar_PMAR016260 [Perkinsus marinus ATCC 50983]